MKKEFEKSGISSILLGKAMKSDLSKYGIAKLGKKKKNKNFQEVISIIEKPSLSKAPSRSFAAGRYIFTNKIFDYLLKIKPDKYREIQLTEAIQNFLQDEGLLALHLEGTLFDCGDKLGYLKAIVHFAIQDKKIGKEFIKILKKYFPKH